MVLLCSLNLVAIIKLLLLCTAHLLILGAKTCEATTAYTNVTVTVNKTVIDDQDSKQSEYFKFISTLSQFVMTN